MSPSESAAVLLAGLAASASASEVTLVPAPLTIERGKLEVAPDGSAAYSTETITVRTQVHRVGLDSEGNLFCELWDVDGEDYDLLHGPSACETILGIERAEQAFALAAELDAAPPGIRGPAWRCTNDAVQRLEEYVSCEVTVTEVDGEGGEETQTRTFSFHELDYQACTNWCMTHWQTEPEEPLGDLMMECGGGHDVGDHPGYVPPSQE